MVHDALMVLREKATTWWRMPLTEKLWGAVAFPLLGGARVALMTVPFRWLAPLLGHDMRTAAVVPLASPRQVTRAVRIGRGIRSAARNTPWDSTCLTQALVARCLLGLNGLPYALYLGVETRRGSDMTAHAWVCTGPAAVTGGNGFAQFTVVGTFVSPKPARTAVR
jgi:hypothetical protein